MNVEKNTKTNSLIELPEYPAQYKNLEFGKPFGTVAGVVSTLPETILKLSESGAFGFITTKSTGPKRQGNMEPIIGQPRPGTLQNAVGLSNSGVEEYSAKMRDVFMKLSELDENPVIIESIFDTEDNIRGWEKSAILMDKAAISANYENTLIELNFSCPHSKGYGSDVGKGESGIEVRGEIVRKVKEKVKSPVFAKLGPWSEPILKELIPNLDESGVDGFVASNTDPGLWPNTYHGKTVITNRKGGISGEALLPKSLLTCRLISQNTELPLIVMGGIGSIHEVLQYRAAVKDNQILGYGIGTKTAGMNTPKLTKYMHALSHDYKTKRDTASRFLDTRELMHYEPFNIRRKKSGGGKTVSFELEPLNSNLIISSRTGQFYYLGTIRNTEHRGPTFEEKPFSAAGNNPLTFVIKNRGLLTKELVNLSENDEVMVRGVKEGKRFKGYGKNLPTPSPYLIAGGTGIAPIHHAAEWIQDHKPTIFYGTENEQELSLLDSLREKSKKVIISTMDGSYDKGYKGTIIEALKDYQELNKNSTVFVCGPELMMKEAIKTLQDKGFSSDNIYCSIERQCECGIGVCGKCGFDGERVCVDGPVYTARELSEEHPSFGKWKYDKQGRKESI